MQSAGAQYMNGQPSRGYGPPTQGYPPPGPLSGGMGQQRPSMPGQIQPPGQMPPPGPWPPGGVMHPPGMKPMPAMPNGNMFSAMPGPVPGGNPGNFGQPPMTGSQPHANQTFLPPPSNAFNQPGLGQMPPGAAHPPQQAATNPTLAPPSSFGQVPPSGPVRPPVPPVQQATPRSNWPLENEMEAMNLSGGDKALQAGQGSNFMPAPHQPQQRPPYQPQQGLQYQLQPGPAHQPQPGPANQPHQGPPQMWEPQPGSRPPGPPTHLGDVGQPSFTGSVAPPPQMYNSTANSVPSGSGNLVGEPQNSAFGGGPLYAGAQPTGLRGPFPPPPTASSMNQGQHGPPLSQRPPPPMNSAPQTMMNMGFGSPSDSPAPSFPGVAGQLPQGPPQFMQPGQQQQPGGQPPMGGYPSYNYGGSQNTKMAQPIAGQPPMGGPMPGAGSVSQPQPQPKRLDPDQMPSPIQVMEDDRRNHSGIFQTGQRGTVPPLVTTNFVVEDQGKGVDQSLVSSDTRDTEMISIDSMCSPRFLRSTMYNVPCTNDILKQTHLPFAITLMPFAQTNEQEGPLPLVDLGQMGPVRCNRCKAYMSPYMVFTDGGRKFQCSFCTCNSEVPPEYFNHLDHTGRRVDCYNRPELSLGAYEFVATSDYCKEGKLPQAPAYIFMIDVSYQSVKSGLVNLLCTRLKNLLHNLPKDAEDSESEIRVGFVTYSNVLHFYNIKGTLAQPQMLVVSDVQDVFVPLLDGFLVKVSESDLLIDMLMSQIAEMFSDSRQTEVVLGPVIQAGLDALRSANRAGKLFIFHSSLPSFEAPGKLKSRDDRNLLGTDKEKTILTPQSNFYTKLGNECVAAGCSVDLFLFPNAYIDVATVSEVCRITGGCVHKYPYFQADLSGDMLIDDLQFAIAKPAAFDAVIRVRTSTGIRAVDFYGNFYMSNTTDVEMACVSSDTSLSVEIKHDDKLSEADGACVQAAVLYTSVGGRRRLRVLNTAFNTCSQIADMFRSCELDTYINFIAKHAIRECLNSSSRQVRENLVQQCAQILACYRKNCASPSSAGQLILPECMKLLPLYINCVIKSGILQAGEITTDDRSYEMHLVNAMTVTASNAYFYPQLIPLHELENNSEDIPTAIRCSYERLQDNGVYLLDNGLVLFLWIGLSTNIEWIRNVLGVASIAQVDIDKTRLQELDNPLSVRVRGIVKSIRNKRQKHMKLVIVRQRDKLEPIFLHYLMEDRGSGNSSSYVDFLCHIHKEIRNLLS